MGGPTSEPPGAASGPLVVLGLGNILLSDDAAGVHAVRLLEGHPSLPEHTAVVDGGTSGLSLLPLVSGARALVLVDAIEVGAAPGHLEVLTGAGLHAAPAKLSVHEVGTSDLLAAARLIGVLPDHTALVGIQPASLAPGLALSPPVAEALPRMVEKVLVWCRQLHEASLVRPPDRQARPASEPRASQRSCTGGTPQSWY